MVRRLAAVAVVTAVVLGGTARSGAGDAPAPAKKDPTAELLAKLRKPVGEVLGELQLQALADHLAGPPGVPVVVNTAAFKASGEESPGEMMVKLPRVKDLSLGAALQLALAERSATFLVRKGNIEIVPIAHAAKEAKVEGADEDGTPRLEQPLVSAIYKEKPFNEAVANLAEEYDLTVVISPQAGDNKTGFVSARLLNVPAESALELLAVQADLRVIRKGTAFLVTSKDHANELFNERLDQERQKIEVERLRFSPPTPQLQPVPPAPMPAAPAPPAEKK